MDISKLLTRIVDVDEDDIDDDDGYPYKVVMVPLGNNTASGDWMRPQDIYCVAPSLGYHVISPPQHSWMLAVGSDAAGGSVASNASLWRLWGASKQQREAEETYRLVGHSSAVTCIKNLSGARIVTGSSDNSLRIWSVFSGEALSTLKPTRFVLSIFIAQN